MSDGGSPDSTDNEDEKAPLGTKRRAAQEVAVVLPGAAPDPAPRRLAISLGDDKGDRDEAREDRRKLPPRSPAAATASSPTSSSTARSLTSPRRSQRPAAAEKTAESERRNRPGPAEHDHATRFQANAPHQPPIPQLEIGPRNSKWAWSMGRWVRVWEGTRASLHWKPDLEKKREEVAALEDKLGHHRGGRYLCVGPKCGNPNNAGHWFALQEMEIDHRPPVTETLPGLEEVEVCAGGYHWTVVLWEDAQADYNREGRPDQLRLLCGPCNASLGGTKEIDKSPPKPGGECADGDECKHRKAVDKE